MVQVTSNCNVPYLVREIHQICKQLSRVMHRRQIGLLHGELLLNDWRNDRLCQRLCVLLLHQNFNIIAVYVRRGGVVLLVFVENYGVRWALVDFHKLLVVHLDIFGLVIVEDVGVRRLAVRLDFFIRLGFPNKVTESVASQSRKYV